MKLYLVRHGETCWNRESRLQGVSDIALNENGIRLARMTGRKIAHIPFDCAYSSPLIRAKDTGNYMLEGRGLIIREDQRLIEASFGMLEGERVTKLRKEQHPILDFFENPEKRVEVDDAESPIDVVNRARSFVEDVVLKNQKKYQNMIVFSHGALIHGMLTCFYQRDVKDFWHDPVQKNCAISVVEVSNGDFSVLEEAKVLVKQI
ncbi:MAG: histidine phosphatase family protein [Anaerostipes sp.]|nr:histidine phosphatase family protein [Anaerostipes sp.]